MPIPVSTLKNRADFLRLNRGKKSVSPYFALRYAPSPEPTHGCRVGYTVTTKCGNAVIRNRIKRRLRAVVREVFPTNAQPGTDYVLIAFAQATPSVAEMDIEELRTVLARVLTHSKRP